MYAKKKTRKIRLLSVLLMLCMVIGLFPMTAFADGPQGQNAKLVSVERYMGAYTISPNGEPNAYYSEAQAVLEGIQTEIKTDDGKTLKVDIDWNWSQYGLPGDDPVMFARIPAAQQEFIGEVVLPNDIDQNSVDLTVRAVVEVPFENYEVITMLNDYAYGQISPSLFGIPEGHRYNCLVTPNTGYEIEMVLVNDENYMAMLAKTTNGYEFSFPVTKNTEVRAYLKPEGTSAADSYNLTTAAHTGGGSISDSKTNLPKNSVETVVITPETDYEIDTIKVNGVDRTAFVNNNKLQITMDYHKEVVVTFKEKTGGGTTTTYDVWVDDKQVTSDNKDDILNDGGTASYDPNSRTLTLNGYNGGAIRANHALTVTLADGSENTVTNPASNEVYCISANNNDLTINGSGDLKVIQHRYNCSAITTDTYGGNLIINMAGDLNVTTYNWHGLYAYGSVTISGSGDVSICIEGKWNGTKGTGIVSGTEDVILSGSGKLTVDAQNAACAVRLKASGKALLLNGTGAPLSFSAGTYAAIVNQADKTSPVDGTNLAYYDQVTGAPDTASVVYDHGTTTPTEIKAANITVTAPKTGETPSSATTADTAYTIASTSWEPTNDPFKADTAYSVVINLEAAGADKFTENTKFYINGEEATLVSPNPIAGNVDQVRVSYTFPKTEAAVTPHTHAGTLVPRLEPTFTTTGLEEHYKCSCGSLFRDLTCNVPTDLTELVIPMLPYEIIEGNDGVYTKGTVNTLTFKANGPMADCTGVKIDGALIDAANYTKVSGSTVITLNNAYLEKLSDGNHSIIVAYGTREEATANFKVLAASQGGGNTGGNTGGSGQAPKTGDNSNMLLWIALIVASCGGIVSIFFVRRKRAHSK